MVANVVDNWAAPGTPPSKKNSTAAAAPEPSHTPAPEQRQSLFAFNLDEYLKQVGGITLCIIDAAGESVSFASNWQTQTGLTTEQCGKGEFMHFFHPQHREMVLARLKRMEAGEEDNAPFRIQYGSTHSGYRWYEASLKGITRRQGEPKLFALTMRDISRETDMARQVRAAEHEAELAVRGRAEFLGHMSHELRTPLNAMLGFSEMMEQGIYGEISHDGYQDYLKNIRESGHMLLDRINDMLEIASIEVGNAQLEEVILEPSDIITLARKLHSHQAFLRDVTIYEPDIFPMVLLRCDRAKLVRAVGNLLSNAIRFSEHGGSVTMSCELREDKTIAFHVSDFGDGMSARQLEMLQDAMQKSHCMFAGSPESLGMGLGLAVAREFVHLHDGDLKISSARGKGTCVTISIPPSRVTSLEVPQRQRRRNKATA